MAAGVAVDEIRAMQSALVTENVLSEIVGPCRGDRGEGGVTEATKTFANETGDRSNVDETG